MKSLISPAYLSLCLCLPLHLAGIDITQTQGTIISHEFPNTSSAHELSWHGLSSSYYLGYPENGLSILGPGDLAATGTGLRHAVAHFTKPSGPVKLGIGDSLILSAKMTPLVTPETGETGLANGLRFGLFDSQNNPQNTFSGDNANPSVLSGGYMIRVDNTLGDIYAFTRDTVTASPLIASSSRYQRLKLVKTNPDEAIFQKDQTYTIKLQITRTAETAMQIKTVISGGQLTEPITIDATDTDANNYKAIASNFDTVAFATTPSDGLGTVLFSDITLIIADREGSPHVVMSPAPNPLKVLQGDPVEFKTLTAGSEPISYQWYHNGNPLPGENNATLTLNSITLASAGNYHIIARNTQDSASSDPAYLDVRTQETLLKPEFASYFSDHMVLQRQQPIPVWGIASPNATLHATLVNSSDNSIAASGTGTADSTGNFLFTLSATPASDIPHILTINNTIDSTSIGDILIGDIWLCGGQSNMAWTFANLKNAYEKDENIEANMKEAILAKFDADITDAANYPLIRVYKSSKGFQTAPQESNSGTWLLNTPDNILNTSATGYYFARALAKTALHEIPIGILDVNYGGSSAEAWMERGALRRLGYPHYADPEPALGSAMNPTILYNSMLHPIRHTSLAGIIYYQGENNADTPARINEYGQLFPDLVTHWRNDVFKSPSIPFYFVQLANYPINRDWALQRSMQMKALALPNTAAAITIDIGNNWSGTTGLHPHNKEDVGRRLALNALRYNYGHSHLQPSGPIADSAITTAEGNVFLMLSAAPGAFLDATKYLDGMPAFQLAGGNGSFFDANATISSTGNSSITLRLSSSNVTAPEKLRYAWHNTPSTPLYSTIINPEDNNPYFLPASPFEITVNRAPNLSAFSQDELITYAFNSNDSSSANGSLTQLPSISHSSDGTLQASLVPLSPILQYEVQQSADLQNWETIKIIPGGSNESVTINATLQSTELFLRIKVSPK